MGGGGGLPYDAEVEYIQSSGTQYINTGIQGGSNAEYSLDFQIRSGYYRKYAQLCASTRTPAAPKIYCENENAWRAQYGGGSAYILNSNNQYDRHVVEFKGGKLTLDGSQIVNIGQKGFGNKDFCICGYTEENLPCYANIFGSQIWIDGVLVRDYKTVRVGQSGYLYDEVSGQLFGDANGGTFGVGNDKTT